MPSAATMSRVYAAELTKVRGGGMESLPEIYRLTKIICILLRLANPDRTALERLSPEGGDRSGLV